VCRKSYIDPRVIDRFSGGEVVNFAFHGRGRPMRDPATLCALEQAVLDLVNAPEPSPIVLGSIAA
jgi:hypothetical protein